MFVKVGRNIRFFRGFAHRDQSQTSDQEDARQRVQFLQIDALLRLVGDEVFVIGLLVALQRLLQFGAQAFRIVQMLRV